MFKIGLTGGLATGKSTVLKLFRDTGAITIDSDLVAQEIVRPHQGAWSEIYSEFGPEYFLPDMNIDRRRLKNLMFSDPTAREKLNRIMHPKVKRIILEDLDRHLESKTDVPVIVDVPLLFEVGWQRIFDRTVLVYARPEIELERLTKREGINRGEAKEWLASQIPIEEKLKLADYVVDNSGTLEQTRDQVMALMDVFRSGKAAKED
ncbi:MAG: dephospho-CoA kinase [Pseudomonadota bacterium]